MKEERAMQEKLASAVGAIQDLVRLGAVQGVHYRVSQPDEDIAKYPIAFDYGMKVEVLVEAEKITFSTDPGFAGFAIVNASGMELVGCPGLAQTMRDGL